MQINYTWSHALDEISNGGFNQFITGNGGVGRVGSLQNPININNIRQYNYGNADYDTRHYVSMNYVYEFPKGPTLVTQGLAAFRDAVRSQRVAVYSGEHWRVWCVGRQ